MIPRPSIRLRLTLWYGSLFLLAGVVLLAVNFVLVARNFPSDVEDLRRDVEQRLELQPGDPLLVRPYIMLVLQHLFEPMDHPTDMYMHLSLQLR